MTGTNKLATLLALILGLVLLAPVGAAAYTETIPDTTFVQPYIGTVPGSGAGYSSSQLYDVIGPSGSGIAGDTNNPGYNTYQVKVDWNDSAKSVKFTIYTNYPQGGVGDPAFPADLWLKDSSNNLYGFAMTTHNTFTAGHLYSNAGFLNANAQDPWQKGGWVYGGAYSETENFHVTGLSPTLLTAGTAMATGSSLNWGVNSDVGTTGTYKVVVDLGAVNTGEAFNQLSFFWGTGNCANDAIFGAANVSASNNQTPVPVPASVLLLGTGLIGLVGLKWRRRKAA